MKQVVIRSAAVRPSAREWGSLAWLAGGEAGGARRLSLARVVIRAGQGNSPHAHPACEEALHLLAGRLEHRAGGETAVLMPGDTVVVPAGTAHAARSVGAADAEMIVAYSAAERDFAPAPPGEL